MDKNNYENEWRGKNKLYCKSDFILFVSGKGHLREALLLHEEALRVNRYREWS